jgi:hypothetical protein
VVAVPDVPAALGAAPDELPDEAFVRMKLGSAELDAPVVPVVPVAPLGLADAR